MALPVSVVRCMAERWRELSGSGDWKGLLDPLDIELRRSIINYGDRASANYYAFNDKTVSGCRGFSRYMEKDFFSKLGIPIRNPYKYNVTKFCYARSEEVVTHKGKSSWAAYVAVATDEGKALLGRREILISWIGTMTGLEDVIDVQFWTVPATDIFGSNYDPEPKVHCGFHSFYTAKSNYSPYNITSARDQVLAEVRKLVDQYKDEDEVSITVTGHSLGAAIGTLNAMDIVANGYNKPSNSDKAFPVTAIVFASPMVGNQGFKNIFDDLNNNKDLHILRIKNKNDPINGEPPLKEYVEVGEELLVDSTLSPNLKEGVNAHNLDVYMHAVAGTQGSKGGFTMEVDLDLALINRWLDGLKDRPDVPAEWWNVDVNKSMVLNDDGKYQLTFYVPDPPK